MFTSLFTGAALVGLFAGLWSKLKAVLMRLWSTIFVNIRLQSYLATATKAYAWQNYKRSPFGSRRYCAGRDWVRPLKRFQYVGYEVLGGDPVLFWNGWRPILIGAGKVNSNGTEVDNDNEITVTFLRGTFSLDRLLVAALDAYNEKFSVDLNSRKERNRFFIRKFVGVGARRNTDKNATPSASGITGSTEPTFTIDTGDIRLIKWRRGEIGPEVTSDKSSLKALALSAETLMAIEEAKHWLQSEKWYRARQIPWTRGWLLHGPPGTGKSSFIRACGEDLDMPIFTFDLSSMSNGEFQLFFQDVRSNVPCIAVFEDIDAVFVGRENVTGLEGGLTFDYFLNTLSGIEGTDGILKVLTTNRIDVLDDALGVPRKGVDGISMSTRPGRADRVIEMTNPDEEGRRKIANRILSDFPQLIEPLVVEGQDDSGAQFVERCARLALAEFWKLRENLPCDAFSPVIPLSDNGRSMAEYKSDRVADDAANEERIGYATSSSPERRR